MSTSRPRVTNRRRAFVLPWALSGSYAPLFTRVCYRHHHENCRKILQIRVWRAMTQHRTFLHRSWITTERPPSSRLLGIENLSTRGLFSFTNKENIWTVAGINISFPVALSLSSAKHTFFEFPTIIIENNVIAPAYFEVVLRLRSLLKG